MNMIMMIYTTLQTPCPAITITAITTTRPEAMGLAVQTTVARVWTMGETTLWHTFTQTDRIFLQPWSIWRRCKETWIHTISHKGCRPNLTACSTTQVSETFLQLFVLPCSSSYPYDVTSQVAVPFCLM